jgi:hypothetical protein
VDLNETNKESVLMISSNKNMASNTFVPPHQLFPIQEISFAKAAPGSTNKP